MDTGVLLESGTNEVEILEFLIAGHHYGINVAKIREILTYYKVTPIPNSHPSVEGIFMPRDKIFTVVNLRRCLGFDDIEEGKGLFFVTNFNNLNTAFHIDEVLSIHRMSWNDVQIPDETVSPDDASFATGVVHIDGHLTVIVDFEKIISEINPQTALKTEDLNAYKAKDRSEHPIVVAEDSKLLSRLLLQCLHKAGYTNVKAFDNGKDAWDYICSIKDDDLVSSVHMVITDIEMPVMDGHRLTKNIKTNARTSFLPVVIFSSLINDEIRRKGEELGADAQLTKPEIGLLVGTMDHLLDDGSL